MLNKLLDILSVREQKSGTSTKSALFIVSLFTLIYNLCFFNRFFPFSEGWYTFLAQNLSDGLVLYRDIPFVLPPVYPLFVKCFISIFGESLIYLRILGLVNIVLISQFTFLLYKQFFNNKTAAVSTMFTMVLFSASIVFMSYDYYPFYIMLATAGAWLLVKSVNNFTQGKAFAVYGILAGILAALAFLTRQNSGMFTMALPIAAACFIALCRGGFRQALRIAIPYVAGSAFVFAVLAGWLIRNDALNQFIQQVFFSAASSKGSLLVILFGWMGHLDFPLNRVVGASFALGLIAFLPQILNVFNKSAFASRLYARIKQYKAPAVLGKLSAPFKELFKILNKEPSLCVIFAAAVICVLLAFFAQVKFGKPLFREVLFVTLSVVLNALLILIIAAAGIFKNKLAAINDRYGKKLYPRFVILAFSFALIWGIGTSYAAASYGTYLFTGLILGYILSKYSGHKFLLNAVLIILFILPCGYFAKEKAQNIYDWHGLGGDSITESKYTIDNKYLKGIYTSKKKKQIIQTIVPAIQKYTDGDDKIFVFSQIPIFYTLSQRKAMTNTVVNWFDVCPDDWARKDKEIIKNNPPKIILYDYMGEEVINIHETLFRNGKRSAQREILEMFDEFVDDGLYIIVLNPKIPVSHNMRLLVRKDVYDAQKHNGVNEIWY